MLEIIYFCFVLFLVLLVNPTSNIFFKFLILNNSKKIHFESKYYRDILKYSPSEVLFIIEKGYSNDKLNSYGLINKYKKMFYVNVLKMYLLGYINIDFSKGKNFEIIKNDVLILDVEYKLIYDYIFNTITSSNKTMLDDINNFVEENYQDNYFFEEWDNLIRKKLSRNGFWSTSFVDSYGKVVKKYYFVCIIILLLIDILFLIFIPQLGLAYLFVYCALGVQGYNDIKKMKLSSNWSIYEYKKVKALKRFLRDFTIIEERPPEYIKILEDYIVYAAIFDMYDLSVNEVMEEIKLFLEVN